MAVGDAYVFPGFLTPALTQLFFPKSPTTFLACFRRGQRRKYPGKNVPLNWVSNSQPPGHGTDTLSTKPSGCYDALFRDLIVFRVCAVSTVFQLFSGDSSQIHISWTILYQYLTSPLSCRWRASLIILTAKGKVTTTNFKDSGLSRPGIEPTTSRLRGGRSNH